MTMEITQAVLNQLMGLIFIVALIYLAIAFALELIRRRAETNPLSDRPKASKSIPQLPIQDSMLKAMEPALGWFEQPPTQIITPNTATIEAIAVKQDSNGTPAADQSHKAAAPQSTQQTREQAREQAIAENGSPAAIEDDLGKLDNLQITPRSPAPLPEETPESLTAELEDFFEDQVKITSPDIASQFPLENLIPPDRSDQEAIWATPEKPKPIGQNLPEPLTAEFDKLFASPLERTNADKASESPLESAIKPDAPDPEDVRVIEPMPSEFDDIWTLVEKIKPPLEATGLFSDLEAILKPEPQTSYLDLSTPIPIAELEELSALDLDELFTSPSNVSPAQYRPTPIEELDRPTDEELEEIFGTQLKVDASEWVSGYH